MIHAPTTLEFLKSAVPVPLMYTAVLLLLSVTIAKSPLLLLDTLMSYFRLIHVENVRHHYLKLSPIPTFTIRKLYEAASEH